MSRFQLFHNIEWSLSPRAIYAVEKLGTEHGIDPDWALEILTQIWPETEIFSGVSSDNDTWESGS